uniref:Uncharacterized protein n=1 Tax=Cucumis melo TaxID=3656 RepID=A0A9I9EKF1_CUCME
MKRGLVIKEHTHCTNSCDNFSELKLVQDRGLSSNIKTNHQNLHLLLCKKPTEKLGEAFTFALGIRRAREQGSSVRVRRSTFGWKLAFGVRRRSGWLSRGGIGGILDG